MSELLRSIGRDERGTSVVETAIVVPTLLMLMAGASDFAMAYWLKLETQQAAARSMELASVGGMENLSVTDLKNEAAAAANVSASKVTVTRWLECNGVAQPMFEGACQSGEVTGRYVMLRVTNSYQPILGPLLPASIVKDGAIAFEGKSSLRLQ